MSARIGGDLVRRWTVHSGIRSLRVSSGGTLLLNGKRLNARGFALHEDWPGEGGAESNASRDRQLAWVQEAGGNILRAHYPLHPHVYEEADRRGILVWNEVPFYQVRTTNISNPSVMRLANQYLRDDVLANSSHPSIIVWSIANELNATVGKYQSAYIRHAARLVRSLDGTRLVGQAFAGYPSTGCQKGYYPLDVLGVNLYFGWYSGRLGEISDRTELGDYLDALHRCYPNKALFATEWGAEANRDGPADEKGTYAFQAQWARDTLGRVRQQAVAGRRDLLDAAGVPHPPRLGWLQPLPDVAAAPEGGDHLRRGQEAGLRRAGPGLQGSIRRSKATR